MGFDGIATAGIKAELEWALLGGKIEKITQPLWDEVNITIRNKGESYRLLLSANTASARVHLTDSQKASPQKAPMFCMLLRKHIAGAKIIGIEQRDFDRVLQITMECYDELGNQTTKLLFAEIMGKHSNIIITDSEYRILGSIKHVDFTVSSVRQVLPGMRYELTPSQQKVNPLLVTSEDILQLINGATGTADKFILNTFTGIGPLNAREIVFDAFGVTDKAMNLLNSTEKRLFTEKITDFFLKVEQLQFSPVLLFKEQDIPWDFNAVDISQYKGLIGIKGFDTMSAALDEFYQNRNKMQNLREKSATTKKYLDNNLARCRKKIFLLQQTIEQSADKEKYKVFGDLLTANLHRLHETASFIEVENYYNNMELVKIPLLSELSPSKNAQRYYRLYQKHKNAAIEAAKQLKLANNELLYLESVSDSLLRAENEDDIEQIKQELTEQNYKPFYKANSAAGKVQKAKPMQFYIDGFEVFVGKNNIQNDTLTLKMSNKKDLWFHVKSFAGSHVVLKTDRAEPSQETIVKVAKAAAYYSSAKESSNVPVDYTEIKNVRKPNGAKPGMVIYVNYNTINVIPQKP